VAICLFVTGDLLYFRYHWGYATAVEIERTLRPDGVAGWLANDRDQFRILAIGSAGRNQGKGDHRNFKNTLPLSSPYVWGLQSVAASFSLELKPI